MSTLICGLLNIEDLCSGQSNLYLASVAIKSAFHPNVDSWKLEGGDNCCRNAVLPRSLRLFLGVAWPGCPSPLPCPVDQLQTSPVRSTTSDFPRCHHLFPPCNVSIKPQSKDHTNLKTLATLKSTQFSILPCWMPRTFIAISPAVLPFFLPLVQQ